MQSGGDAVEARTNGPVENPPPDAALENGSRTAGNWASRFEYDLLHALQSMRIDIPGQLSFVGTDNPLVSEILAPPLTVIERDNASLGKQAARLLIQRLDPTLAQRSLERMTLPSRVILRRSCAPITKTR